MMEQTNERWRPVRGYEGTFLVSDLGRVMNNRGNEVTKRFDNKGELSVTLKGKDFKVSRLVGLAFIPHEATDNIIEYIDGDKTNCQSDNLRWVEGQPVEWENDSKPVYLVREGIITIASSKREANRITGATKSVMDRAINNPANRTQTKDGYSFASNKTDAEALAAWQANPLPDLDGEEWKPIDWIDDVDPNMYMVSNMGRVKNVAKYYPILVSIIYTKKKDRGYAQLYRLSKKDTHPYILSRLVATAFLPNPDNLPEVDHLDADHHNNSVNNLEWVTSEENIDRAKKMGLLGKTKG
jgi:hypothetical protein